MRSWAILLALAVAVASCGSGDVSETTMGSPSADTTTTLLSADTTASQATTSTSPATTSNSEDPATEPAEISIEFVEGEVIGPDQVEVALGEMVDVWVLSDVDDEIHVHGYDLTYALEAGEPFNLSFLADIPGIFEVEVHTGHTLLFEIEVTG